MKITAPISRIEEIAPLAEAGADEFYCSVVSDEWIKQFSSSATSRRVFGNLPDCRDLEQAVTTAHTLGKTITLTMNAQHYTAAQLDALLKTAAWFDELGGDAVIAADAMLVRLLGRKNHRFNIHVSSIATCRNREAVAFYRDLGALRIIFPRDITLREMEAIVAAEPEMEYEAFVLNEGCVFEEGVCHTIHLPGKLGGPICLDRYQSEFLRVNDKSMNADEEKLLAENENHYQRWLWYRFSCGFSVTTTGMPYGPCGLCALPRLLRTGITSVKIAGRDAPSERKIKSVAMVNSVRTKLNEPEAAVKEYAQHLRDQPSHCHSGLMCYYPEVLDSKPQDQVLRKQRSG
jgi:collagenase-like PrtC family protease